MSNLQEIQRLFCIEMSDHWVTVEKNIYLFGLPAFPEQALCVYVLQPHPLC